MVNLLSELEGLCTQIPICPDQRCAGLQREKIHVINVTPTWGLKRVGTAHKYSLFQRTESEVYKSSSQSQLNWWQDKVLFSRNRSYNSLRLRHLKRQLSPFNLTQGSRNLLIVPLVKTCCEWRSKPTCGAALGANFSMLRGTSGLSAESKLAGGRGKKRAEERLHLWLEISDCCLMLPSGLIQKQTITLCCLVLITKAYIDLKSVSRISFL